MIHAPIRFKTAICIWVLTVLGCASTQSVVPPTTHNLAGSPGLPLNDIETFFSPAHWQKLRQLDYEGYVAIRAEILSDGSVKLRKIIESFPDTSWNDRAYELGRQVTLRATKGASQINETAEIYVVFFKRGPDGNLALVFGRQSNEPPSGMGHRALYLNTTHY